MNEELKQKIEKVYSLSQQGTDGEKLAAKNLLDKLMKKYNLDDIDISTIGVREYKFKYSTKLDMILFIRICRIMLNKKLHIYKDTCKVKELQVNLKYEEWVLLDSAYEYFRRHMKAQYREFVLPFVKKNKSKKTKQKIRQELSIAFINRYIIESGLFEKSELTTTDSMSEKERRLFNMMRGVEGGAFKRQIVGNNLLQY